MNRDFKIIDNEVIVLTDDKGEITKELTNNIEEILVAENNIEDIEKNIEKEKNKIFFSKKKMKSGWFYIGCGALWTISFVLNSINGNWLASFFNFLCITSYSSIGYFGNVKSELKSIKASKFIIEELEDNLVIEKEKLNELKKDKTNDLMCVTNERKIIHTSQKIIDLRKKLDVIHDYQIHKRKLIHFYKKGILKKKLEEKFYIRYCDSENYKLLEELIKNDLNVEDNIVEQKIKKLK